ncbi:DUF421 domain-containing protein [Tepidibacter formicigenes]|uniref:Uncharacterized membrane protein YcaP, DUF421 family n=1 Tax=Tepidibacter formicigenes DSM 15518 TaxID=1123349 RepID=A0A1M6MC17_9FIRM|nr:DUF421 domain-containing protein [Tepidibacter formicigenes]SHJ81016.1 Uncharacterized membrane protein YcaP, DUF421 family [Tepidibacter formicigenes DSM 15518]
MKTWIQILLRSISIFFVTLILVRIMGKRQVGKTTPFNFISYIVIGILVALISANIIKNLAFGFIVLGVWVLFSIGLDYLCLKSKLIHDWVYGKETILIKNGKIMEENLNQVRFTGEELLRELRSKNVFNLMNVEFAVMESTGEVNVMLKSDKKPVTSYDLGKQVSPKSEPETVILDGNIIDESLSNMGLNRDWLISQLEGMGVSIDNVFIGQVDSSGDLYIDLFDDSIQIPKPQVKELIYANLEKAQSDLLSFALETENQQAKDVYLNDANKLEDIVKKLEPYLLH